MTATLLLSLIATSAYALPSGDAKWDTLDSAPAKVECTTSSSTTWCRSQGVLKVDSAVVASTLESFHKQVEVFEAVIEMNELEKGLLHVVLDYPMPFDDRDYVARFTPSKEGDVTLYRWVPETHPAAPVTNNRVRLTQMEGEWRITPMGDETLVQYTWQGDVGGNFPNWALPKARAVTGGTVLADLAQALNVSLRPAS